MPVPLQLNELVSRFRDNLPSYKAGSYNETQVRREFVDPLFELLGWDVTNREGYAETYKDVVHEDAIRIGSSNRAPDYCFRIGGTRKFFVEAKKPSVNVKDDPSPAYQIRRYAWSSKLPIAVLTDFEEFAVYDCRRRPVLTDKAATERIMYLRFENYEQEWEKLSGIFSRSAVLKGAFDRYHLDSKAKKGTETVDEAFLKELDTWRENLARNIAHRNRGISAEDLNTSVQRIIDRVVFLRICEARSIEDYGRLRNAATGKDCYAKLCELFEKADRKYNSGLFHFKHEGQRASTPDALTRKLKIDDCTIKDILSNLYYPESPYEFSVLPADILGKVYEEFLGKTVRLTAKGQAKIEAKPEVRKAGGVYYTPEYVVEYIVEQTLGLLLNGASFKDVAKLRVLDPACGSGSFLLVAYQRLLNWYRDWYIQDGTQKHARGKNPPLFQSSRGEWLLTINKRKEVLLNNIFGVDIDPQAVEVTKLSLLLKVLEGEVDSLKNLELFQERALPDLDANIQSGNSLVDARFLSGLPTAEMVSADDETAAVSPFDWKKAFPDAFAAGGFDVVIGNPPYLSYAGRQSVDLPARLREFFNRHYQCSGWPTSHSFFIERSVRDLSSRFVAFIVPDQVGHLEGYKSLREVVTTHSHLRKVKYWGEKVFKGVTTPALTFIADRKATGATLVAGAQGTEASGALGGSASWFFSPEAEVLDRLRPNSFSARPYIADCGVRTTAAAEQVIPAAEARKADLVCLEGKNFGRYWCGKPTKAVRLDHGVVLRSSDAKYDSAEFLIRQTAAYPIVGPHRYTKYFRNSAHALMRPESPMDIRYLVGLLNSKVVRFAYLAGTKESGQKAFPQVKLGALERLPLRAIDWNDKEQVKDHHAVVELVQALLDLQLRAETAPDSKIKAIESRIETLDSKLDELVFEMYRISAEDRVVVENTVAASVAPPNFTRTALDPEGPGIRKVEDRRGLRKRVAG